MEFEFFCSAVKIKAKILCTSGPRRFISSVNSNDAVYFSLSPWVTSWDRTVQHLPIFFCIHLVKFPVSCFHFNMPRKQLPSVISWFSYLGIRDVSQCLQGYRDSTLIKQWSNWLSVYSYKAILLSVMLRMIICHVLFNYVMIVLSWPFHLVLLVFQGLCFSLLPWWPEQLIPRPYTSKQLGQSWYIYAS